MLARHESLYNSLWEHVTQHCNFRFVPDPNSDVDRVTWTCNHDLKGVTRFCTSVGIPPDPIRRFCHDHGGYCDCEVIFNMRASEHPGILDEFEKMLRENRIDVAAAMKNWRERCRTDDDQAPRC